MYKIKTRKFLNRCLPDQSVVEGFADAQAAASDVGVTLPSYAIYSTSSNGNTSWFNDFIGDMYFLRSYIFGFGLAVALGVAFLYLFVLRIPFLLFIVIWTSILALLAVLCISTALLWTLANAWQSDGVHSYTEYRTVRIFSYIGIALCVIYSFLILVMRARVNLAIGVIKQAAKAMMDLRAIVLLPIVQAAGLVSFMIFWVIYLFFLASSGDIKVNTAEYVYNSVSYTYSYRTFTYKPAIRYAFLFMLFALFWTSEFIVAIGQLVIAMCFSCWYFTKDKKDAKSGVVAWVSELNYGINLDASVDNVAFFIYLHF
jgi:hypothetical protein